MNLFSLKYRGTRFPLRQGEAVVGRSPYCSIVLSNQRASRQHCALRLDGDVLLVRDLNSANGTWVNNERVTEPRILQHADIVRVGTDVLEVIVSDRRNSERSRSITGNGVRFDDEEETTAHTDGVSVELIEALISSAMTLRTPAAASSMLATAQRMLDLLLAQHESPLSPTDKTKLMAMVETVSAWSPNGEITNWRQRVLEALQRSPSR